MRLRLTVFVGLGARHLRRHGLAQDEGRAQVRFHVPVPAFSGRGPEVVVFEDRGVVDQNRDRLAQRLGGGGQQALHLGLDGQVGAQGVRLPAHRPDLGHRRLGLIGAARVMHRDVMAAFRKAQRHRPAQPFRRARHQCGHVPSPYASSTAI